MEALMRIMQVQTTVQF